MNFMKDLFAPLITLSLAAAGVALPASAGVMDILLAKSTVEVITVTDMTAAGALRRRATPAHPVYYRAVNAGYRESGQSHYVEKAPPQGEILGPIVEVLRKQGYLPATKDHAPTLLLVWFWGTWNYEAHEAGGTFTEGITVSNRDQLLRFMGADKIPTNAALFQSHMEESIRRAAVGNLDIISIVAYDFGALQRRQATLLWTTKISCPSERIMMKEAFPTMLAVAGPNIGRDTPRPVLVDVTDRFKGEVKIGELTTVPDGIAPIIDATSAPAKPPAPVTPKP